MCSFCELVKCLAAIVFTMGSVCGIFMFLSSIKITQKRRVAVFVNPVTGQRKSSVAYCYNKNHNSANTYKNMTAASFYSQMNSLS